jgi:hypothetical protein
MSEAGIAAILRAERGAVALTYGLTLVENACMLAYPALTGLAVDALLKRRYGGLATLWRSGCCTWRSPSRGSATTPASSWG